MSSGASCAKALSRSLQLCIFGDCSKCCAESPRTDAASFAARCHGSCAAPYISVITSLLPCGHTHEMPPRSTHCTNVMTVTSSWSFGTNRSTQFSNLCFKVRSQVSCKLCTWRSLKLAYESFVRCTISFGPKKEHNKPFRGFEALRTAAKIDVGISMQVCSQLRASPKTFDFIGLVVTKKWTKSRFWSTRTD